MTSIITPIIKIIYDACHSIYMHLPHLAQTPSTSTPAFVDTSKLSPKQFRSKLLHLMMAKTSFYRTSHQVMQLIEKQLPESTREFDAFLCFHQEKLQKIREKGWLELKTNPATGGDRMKMNVQKGGLSMENFRVTFLNKTIGLVQDILRSTGCEQVGRHDAFGTDGYNSDIDTNFMPPKDMPEEMQMMEKNLIDIICFSKLGGFSGDKLDIESYIEHPSSVYGTGNPNFFFTKEGKQGFSRVEANMYFLQMRRTFKANIEGWVNFKKIQLERAFSPDYCEALAHIFVDVDTFEDNVTDDINRVMIKHSMMYPKGEENNMSRELLHEACEKIKAVIPNADKAATMSYKSSRLIKLSKQMENDKIKLKKLEPQLVQLGAILSNQALPPQLREEYTQELLGLEQEADQIKIRILMRAGLRLAYFPEGYVTHGAFQVICEREQGQRYQQTTGNALKQIELQRRLGPLEALRSIREEEQIKAIRPGLHYSRSEKTPPTHQEMISALNENLSMYINHFNHKAESSTPQESVIANSKYTERTVKMGMQLISQLYRTMAQKGVIPHCKEIEKECQEIYFITSELEKCKRQVILNYTATKELLLQRFEEKRIIGDNNKMIAAVVNVIRQNTTASLEDKNKFNLKLDAAEENEKKDVDDQDEKIKLEDVLEEARQHPKFKEDIEAVEKQTKLLNDAIAVKNKPELKRVIEKILKMGEPGGKFSKEKTLLPEDKLLILRAELAELPFIQPVYDTGITSILQARCGFPGVLKYMGYKEPIEMPEGLIKKQHKKALEITLDKLNLSSAENIEKFNQRILDLTINISNLCLQHGVGYLPGKERDQDFSLINLWQQAE